SCIEGHEGFMPLLAVNGAVSRREVGIGFHAGLRKSSRWAGRMMPYRDGEQAVKEPVGAPRSKGWMYGVVFFLCVFGFAMVPGIYHDCRASNIRAKQAHYTGTVVSIVDSHDRVNDDPVVTVTVEVDFPGRGKVRGDVVDAISVVHLPRFQPGKQIDVWVDP